MQTYGKVTDETKTVLINACWDSQDSVEASTPPQLALQNYFELPAWVRAVVSNDINMFHVALLQNPAQLATTLAAKLE